MRYYDVQRNWRKIKRYLNHPTVKCTLVHDFNKFTFGRWGKEFTFGQTPSEFESCDWQINSGHRGRYPAYWSYVKHSACHWLVNFNMVLAELVEPQYPWRIVTSQDHSTTWNGEDMLFDMNFMALGIPPDEAWQLANNPKAADHEILAVGEYMELGWAHHYSLGYCVTDPDIVDANCIERQQAWDDYLESHYGLSLDDGVEFDETGWHPLEDCTP